MTAPAHNTDPTRLRAVAGIRFAVGIFLTVLGALMFSRGAYGLAALPLALRPCTSCGAHGS